MECKQGISIDQGSPLKDLHAMEIEDRSFPFLSFFRLDPPMSAANDGSQHPPPHRPSPRDFGEPTNQAGAAREPDSGQSDWAGDHSAPGPSSGLADHAPP